MTSQDQSTSAPRRSRIERKTAETDLTLDLNVDGSGSYSGEIGVPFFEHMLNLLARHSGFDLTIEGKGDTEVDAHHTVEDIGIVLGQALAEAVGDKRGMRRYGHAYVPMEETLARTVVDVCNRPYFTFGAVIPKAKIGEFDAELGEEFFRALAFNARLTLHIDVLREGNLHHMLEACFKSLGLALRDACNRDLRSQSVLSTKGVL